MTLRAHIQLSLALMTALAPGNSLFAQQTTTWMSIGSFQNWYASAGCEIEEGRTSVQQDGFEWPAIYSYQDMQAAKGLWVGTTNYTEGSTLYPYKVVHVGPRVDGIGEFLPVLLETVSRFPVPVVNVNGNPQTLQPVTIDRVDPTLPCDRMIRNVVRTAIGVTMTRRIMGFGQEYHDNYAVSEYTFRNDSGKTLTGVRFFFQYRMAPCRETGQVIGNPTTWGINTMIDTRGDSVKSDVDDYESPNKAGSHMRIQYAWHGKFPTFTAYDNIGGPIWVPSQLPPGDPADTIGRLGAAQFAGFLTLHADRSPGDTSDDPSQPSTTTYFGSDEASNPPTGNNSQFNARFMAAEYAVMSSGHKSPRHADMVQPDGKFDAQTGDPSLATTGGFSAANGYGPYTLSPGDSVRIIIAEGASGLSRERCISVGRQYRHGLISAKAKNDSVLTGKDSLFQTFRRATAHYKSGWAAPQPPLPPRSFTVTGGPRSIRLAWDVYSLQGPAITGFRIFRSNGKYNAPDSLIYAAGPNARSYSDSVVAANGLYFYYVQSVGSPSENNGSAMTPAGVALTSNRMYTQTVDGASLLPDAISPAEGDLPTTTVLLQNYPNPFNPATTIRYGLPARAHVRLVVYTMLGQQIETLVDESQDAGYHEAKFDGGRLASGVYFYRLSAGGHSESKRFVLVR